MTLKPSCAPVLQRIETLAGRTFGVGDQPLVSRGAFGEAAESMPGMMDTVLNVGLNPACVAAMAQRTGNRAAPGKGLSALSFRCTPTPSAASKTTAPSSACACFASSKQGRRAIIGKGDNDDLDAERSKHSANACAISMPRRRGTSSRRSVGDALCQRQCRLPVVEQRFAPSPIAGTTKLDGLLGTAVNVQMMCPSEVSGVMFTANPVNQAPEIIIEFRVRPRGSHCARQGSPPTDSCSTR